MRPESRSGAEVKPREEEAVAEPTMKELLDDAKPMVGEALVGEAVLPPFEEYQVLGVGDFHVKPV